MVTIFLSVLSTCLGSGLDLPKPTLETLSNGLTIAWFPNERIPVVDIVAAIQVGERHDPVGKSGTSTMLSSLLDRGAGGLNALDFSQKLETIGGALSTNSNPDSMTVGIRGLSVDWPILVDLFTDVLMRPNLYEDEFQKTRAKLLDSWNHISDHASSLAALAFQRLISVQTPYVRGPMVSQKELQAVTLADVKQYYSDYFAPSRTLVAVVGKFKKELVRTQLLRKFTMWVGPNKPLPRLVLKDTRLSAAKGEIALIHRPGLNQAQVVMGTRGPLLNHPDRDALLVANSLFGEYFNSRLNSNIRDRQGLTYAIGSQWTFNRELGVFSMSASTRSESAGQLVIKLKEALVELRRGPITDLEVETAKKYLIGGFPVRYSTLNSLVGLWLSLQPYQLGDDYLNGYAARISKIQAKDVLKAVQLHLNTDNLITVVAGDADALAPAFKKEKLKFKRFSAEDLK